MHGFVATTTIMGLSWFLLLSLPCILLVDITHSAADDRKVYIVYMGDKPKLETLGPALHANMVQNVVGNISNIPHDSLLLHCYKRSFNGFAAKLTVEEAQIMAGKKGVVSVFPSQKKQLHTTNSWDFLGFPKTVKRSTIESDIIVGVFDGGIWPESESFSEAGFGPPPKKWKGICQPAANFTCNNKIIGARYYSSNGFIPGDIMSARDSDGHGTHTASTAAGNIVSNANVFGLGSGTARGGVPSARIAVYKVCWSDGCGDADILAAFDDAIADGVDILSLSLGDNTPVDYFRSAIAIGAFHAFRKGILSSTSAGNEGPNLKTITNFAPWILSVAASTINRKFVTKVQLGNLKIYEGIVPNTFDLKNKLFPLIYAGDAPNKAGGVDGLTSRLCLKGTLEPNLVKGKIVLCDETDGGEEAYLAGATGIILQGRGVAQVMNSLPLPASCVGLNDGSSIFFYINSTSNPTATILKSDEISDILAPYVPSFSSRGPNPATPNILKPDLAAPGAYILAAWPPTAPSDGRAVKYNIISGTSMACPHATAVAAYIKSFHPTWSPAAIQSALITTAKPMNANLNPEAEFAYGAGHIDPTRALYPGLVYEADEVDYIKFLCAQGYSAKTLQVITGDMSNCSGSNLGTIVGDLNYPSFALSISHPLSISGVFHRTVTNVGSPTSTYKAKVLGAPEGLEINVNPSVLSFKTLGEKKSFSVTIKGSIGISAKASASLVWDDGTFQVRSPIVVYVIF